jgi:tetraacyldisaccharide 4'-kinase
VPVICLGNLSAGGVGKTPAVAWLARRLSGEGRRVAIVSRGHGGERAIDPLVVSEDGEVRASAAEAGDEASMLARSGVASIVVVARKRTLGARLALERGAGLVLLDDGFQHRYLARDLDIVLTDHGDPLAGGRGLPAGLLRESPRGFERAGVVLLTRSPDALAQLERPLEADELPAALRDALESLPPGSRPPVLASRHVPHHWVDAGGETRPLETLRGRRVLAVAAIGQPESFRATLEACGCEVAGLAAFADHHAFGGADLRAIETRATQLDVDLVITTEKDAVRWPEGFESPARLAIDMTIGSSEFLLGKVREVL